MTASLCEAFVTTPWDNLFAQSLEHGIELRVAFTRKRNGSGSNRERVRHFNGAVTVAPTDGLVTISSSNGAYRRIPLASIKSVIELSQFTPETASSSGGSDGR